MVFWHCPASGARPSIPHRPPHCAHGSSELPRAPRLPCQSAPEPGEARRGVGWCWTGATGWGRVAHRDGLWCRGISKKACFFCPLRACRIGQRCQELACSRQAGGRLLCYNSHRSTVFVTPYGTSSSDREVRIILTTRSGNLAAA
jgi:hypothetical protein